MTSAIRLIAALFTVVFSTAFFGPAHRLLPQKVRNLSFGFIAMVVMFFSAAIARHVLVGGADPQEFLIAHSVYFALLMAILGGGNPAALLLYMAASSGVDLVVAGAGLAGVDILDPTLRTAALAWEFVAAGSAYGRLKLARRSAAL
jgi:hypothetical protein